MAEGSSTPLRVGILVDRLVQPAWVARAVADVQESGFAQIVLVVVNGATAGLPSSPHELRERPDLALYHAYTALDDFLFGAAGSAGAFRIDAPGESRELDAFAPTDIDKLVQGAVCITLSPTQSQGHVVLADDDIQSVTRYDLDVALKLGFEGLSGSALHIARHGIWSYHHGDPARRRGGPAGFWEVMERDEVTGCVLERLTEDPEGGIPIKRSFASTDKYSVRRSKNNYFWTSSSFVLRALRDLRGAALEARTGEVVAGRPFVPYSDRLYDRPRNGEMAGLLLRHGYRVARDRIGHRLRPERWVLGYRLTSAVPSLHRFRYMVPQGGAVWADPFPVAADDRYYIFFEEQDTADAPARISVIEMGCDGAWTSPEPVLSANYHLSYPSVFEWHGCFYMIPETVATERVELYRCIDFPHRWELHAVLLEGVRAVDATVADIDGRLWMFVSIAVEGARDFDELHLFSADSPTGPWKAHRTNPVKSDARSSRPAGRLFEWGGKLHRPAQDCGRRYGYGVSINVITQLDDHGFEEREVSRMEPNWDRSVVATHTLNTVPGLTVVDARLRAGGRLSHEVGPDRRSTDYGRDGGALPLHGHAAVPVP